MAQSRPEDDGATTAAAADRFDLIVFDWDGTLIDSTAAITEAIRLAAADLGLPVPTPEQASFVIGLGLHDALHRVVPSLPHERLPAFVERYRVHYFARDGDLIPFGGIPELLDSLGARGTPLAIATGKSRVGLNRALEHVGWRHRFLATRCADEGAPKPDPWMLLDICEETGVSPARTLMIGDTTHDIEMAMRAGAAAVAVCQGAHPRDALEAAQPLACLAGIAELSSWLESNR